MFIIILKSHCLWNKEDTATTEPGEAYGALQKRYRAFFRSGTEPNPQASTEPATEPSEAV